MEFHGTIKITDEDDVLSADESIIIQIINKETGKVVYTKEESYGTYSIPLDVENLIPDTSYVLVASAAYTIDDVDYTKNFLYKTFATSSIGVSVEKESYTDETLTFSILFTDENVESVVVTLLDSDGNTIANTSKTLKNTTMETQQVTFEGLTSNTDYIVQVSEIKYSGVTQAGENWKITKNCTTLKKVPEIKTLNYSVSKRDGTFTLYIEDVVDEDEAIESYTYVVYEYTTILSDEGTYTTTYDTSNIIYQRETTSKEITITVGDEGSDGIARGKYYGFKVIANTYDNEKYVEIESSMCGAFALNGKTFPSVKFERVTSDYPPTEICGYLYIIDNENTIIVGSDDPLTISYYSDVDETKQYLKRTSLDDSERTEDEDGNSVIKIWIDLGKEGSSTDGLKSNTSYTFTVQATVDLNDGNEAYKNAYIGSAIVTTTTYESITANLTTTNISANTFTVELNLEADEVSEESLTSVTIALYEGSGDINTGERKNWSRTITTSNYITSAENAKYDADVTSLQDLLFDNTLYVTPSFIGGGSESDYTDAYYTVVVTATVDGTSYSNKIPIKAADDNDDNTGNTTYTDSKTSETYEAAYIIVAGKGTTASVSASDESQKINATAITNSNATKYGLTSDSDLEDSTYVGYYVSTNFVNTGSLTAYSITYYVWDDDGNPVCDESGNQITKTIKFSSQDYAPSAVFELNYGTDNAQSVDNASGLHRGCAYIFSYTVTYLDNSGNEVIWPISESTAIGTYDAKTMATDTLYPNKQTPIFVMYPITSDETSITYRYSCTDIDSALKYNSSGYAYLTLSISEYIQNSNIEIQVDGELHDVTINSLNAGTTYIVGYLRNLNKARSTSYSSTELLSQGFDGIVECDDIVIDEIVCNDENGQNNVTIKISGENASRVVAIAVTLISGEEKITTDLLEMENDNDEYYATINLLNIINENNYDYFIGTDIEVKVTAYYDNGRIGFIPDKDTTYSAYTNSSGTYLKLYNGNFTADELSGNMFKYTFTEETAAARLFVQNMEQISSSSNSGTVLSLAYSSAGLMQNGNVVVQKQIDSITLDEDTSHIINIENIIVGIKVNSINTTISTATIKAELVNPLNINIEELVIEIWHSKDSEETPNWDECDTTTIKVDELGNFTLDNLNPSEYYYIRFKYLDGSTYIYTYDASSTEDNGIYTFETLTTIGIDDVKVEYSVTNYANKYLNISYNVNSERSNMYEKTVYTFYEEDGVTKVYLKEENIIENNSSSQYSIVDGSLVVTNGSYPNGTTFSIVEEQINISPTNNVFEMGKNYILEITPIVTLNETVEYEIENIRKVFKLDKLSAPTVGLKMARKTSNGSKYISVTVTIKDNDCIIYGDSYGEYEIHIYKYTDSKDNKTEVNIYDYYQDDPNDITGTTFNIKTKSQSVYAIDDIDYSYNYVVEIVLKYDYENKGQNLVKDTISYTLKAIEGDVSIGSPTFVQSGAKCEVRFYDDYYNIDAVNAITYTIYNLADSTSTTNSYQPEWTLVSEDDGTTYYMITLPTEFSTGTYTIQMNLYVNSTLVGSVNATFICE